ncbi:MAG: YdbH domain-containing protein [Candidatus Binatia bacterium]|nr:YdbH domain-containing protein [Candidatus Binatia bacterium]
MASDAPRPRARRRLLWTALALVPLVVAGLVVLVAVEARGRLPQLLSMAVRELAPEFKLQVAGARLESSERLVAEQIVLAFRDAEAPFFTADRVEVDFAWAELLEARVGAIRMVRPRGSWTEQSSGSWPLGGGAEAGEGSEGAAVREAGGGVRWSIGRLSAADGHLGVSFPAGVPEIALDFDLDLADVGSDALLDETKRLLAVSNLTVGPAAAPFLSAPTVESELSFAGLNERRLESLRVAQPEVDLSVPLRTGEKAEPGSGEARSGFWVGRFVVENGHLQSPAKGSLPKIDVDFAWDLTDVGDSKEIAKRLQVVALSDVRVSVPGQTVEPLLSIPKASAEVSVAGVLRNEIEAVRITDGALLLDSAGRAFLSSPQGEPVEAGAMIWRIGTLDIGTLAVHVAELGPPIPDVKFDVHTALNDLPLSAAGAAIADQAQQLEMASLVLNAPFYPFEKVLTVGSVFIDFSLGGLLRQKIAQVKLLRPTIYLAEELFWYIANERKDEASQGSSPWTIDLLKAELGNLILEIGTARRVGLPITFETEVRDVKLDNLADLKLAAKLVVPEESYSFPDYEVSVDSVRGEMQFDYPPGKGSDNFVSTLYADAFEWRNFGLQEGWLSLTFDPNGISGKFGGAGYEGYVNGGLTVPYASGAPWVGWVSASEIDLAKLTSLVAGGAVTMSGPFDANVALTIANQSLRNANGGLTLSEPGHLEIKSLGESKIPPDWPSWQQDLARIALEALRDFDYEEGKGMLHFEDGTGLATLALTGPDGGRNLQLHYHGEGTGPHALDVKVASREDGD